MLVRRHTTAQSRIAFELLLLLKPGVERLVKFGADQGLALTFLACACQLRKNLPIDLRPTVV